MRFVAALALLVVLGATGADEKSKAAKKADRTAFVHLGDVHAEVSVLNVLYNLQLTGSQLKALQLAAPRTMQKPPPRKLVKVSARYRTTLVELRDALVEGDEERIEELFGKLDTLREKEDPELDEVEITEAARAAAPELLRRLSARQVAAYLAGIAEFPDPYERLREAITQSQKLRGMEWLLFRDDTAYQVGWLVGGLNTRTEEKVREGATRLLNRAARIEEKDFADQRPALLKEARALVGTVGPTDVFRNFMERVLAETLSSHRLTAVVEALQKRK